MAIAIRHHTGDVMVLDEIFSQAEYEPPPGVVLDLPDDVSAVDLGANIGLFGAWLLGRFPRARILAYEADPGNAALHRRAIEANGLGERWRLVEAFAGTAAGTTSFTAGGHAVSRAGEGIEVPVVDVLPELAAAELVKIDVEGVRVADPGRPALSSNEGAGRRARVPRGGLSRGRPCGCRRGEPRGGRLPRRAGGAKAGFRRRDRVGRTALRSAPLR